MGYIYILTSPNGKSYIGQTIRPIEKRLEEHRKGQSSSCRAFYNAIQYHGWENFEKDWYECPDEDLNFDEELLVREIGTLAPNGYNLKEGGGNGKMSEDTKQKMRKPKSEEHKRKISEANIGKILSEEHRRNIGQSHVGKTRSDEAKQKMSEVALGKTHTDETKQKMKKPKSEEHRRKISEASIGKILSEEHKRKLSEAQKGEKNHNSKKVYQYDQEGIFLGSFESCREANRHLKKAGSKISACACGHQKTAYGFKWSYSIM